MTDRILCSADANYFHKFAIPFVVSATNNDHAVHLNLIGVDKKSDQNNVQELLNSIMLWSETMGHDISFSFSPYDPIQMNHTPIQEKVRYSCGRLEAVLRLFEKEGIRGQGFRGQGFFLLDIDTVILKPFKFPSEDLAIYLREDEDLGSNDIERRGMKLLGSFFIRATKENYDYILRVVQHIQKEKYGYWFLDQISLYEELKDENKNNLLDLKNDDRKFLDWEWSNNSYTFSAKGPRKNDSKYKRMCDDLKIQFYSEIKNN